MQPASTLNHHHCILARRTPVEYNYPHAQTTIKNSHKRHRFLTCHWSPPHLWASLKKKKTTTEQTPEQNKNIQNLVGSVHEAWTRAGAQHCALLLTGDSANANDPNWADQETISDPENISSQVVFSMCNEKKLRSLHYKLQKIGRAHVSIYLVIRN